MPSQGPRPPDLARVVEKQMRNWELARAQRPAPEERPPVDEVEHFVTISRMVGAGGHSLATALGERLDWPVFDKEILQAMAGDDQLRGRLYEALDERDVGWIENSLRWLVEGGLHKGHYFHRLGQTILAIARQGHAIFLGRGADLILPRDRGLRVELVAPPEHCARAYAERHGLSEALARAEIERIQRERTEFVREYFGEAAKRPARHDLVLNTATFPVPDAVELVCCALQRRGIIS